MPIVRTYRCPDCQNQWDHFHLRSDEDFPDCPKCAAEPVNQPAAFTIRTARGQAMDVAQRVAEKQFGMTDMNDSQREGDVAFKAKPEVAAAAESMFKGNVQVGNMSIPATQIMAGAKAGMQGTPNPVDMLHRAKPQFPFRVIDPQK